MRSRPLAGIRCNSAGAAVYTVSRADLQSLKTSLNSVAQRFVLTVPGRHSPARLLRVFRKSAPCETAPVKRRCSTRDRRQSIPQARPEYHRSGRKRQLSRRYCAVDPPISWIMGRTPGAARQRNLEEAAPWFRARRAWGREKIGVVNGEGMHAEEINFFACVGTEGHGRLLSAVRRQ